MFPDLLGRIRRSLVHSSVEVRSLFAVLLVMAGLSIFRAFHLWTTGFLVTDEYLYIYNGINSLIYGARYFFGDFNIAFFHVFGITDLTRFTYLFPLYLFFWSAITFLSMYGILKALRFEGTTVAVTLLSSLLLFTFTLLSLGFLTEPVGLAAAMAGIFFTIKFAVLEQHTTRFLGFAFLAALCFSAARYSREPYVLLLLAGLVIFPLIGYRHFRRLKGHQRRGILVAASVLLFMVPAGTFLVYPQNFILDVPGYSAGFAQTIILPVGISPVSTFTSTNISIVTTIVRTTLPPVTKTTVINGTTQTTIQNARTTTTVSTLTMTSTHTTTAEQPNVFLKNGWINTWYIFLGGLVLGWNPILAVVGAAGLIILLVLSLRRPFSILGLVLVLAVLSLMSYLFVSYLFSNDPTYLSVAHYSTIIRFSDTAVPAYFLGAPFAIARILKRRSLLYGFVGILLVSAAALGPLYQTYATSNIINSGFASQNPLTLDYRVSGIPIRDYFLSHPSSTTSYVIGYPPFDWWWTPGSSILSSVHVFPYMNQTAFQEERLSDFYVWGDSMASIQSKSPYLIPLISTGTSQPSTNGTVPYSLLYSQLIYNITQNGDGFLVHVRLSWNG